MAQASQGRGVNVQVTTRNAAVRGLRPLTLRWRTAATFGTLANRWHRLTRILDQRPEDTEDAVSIANCHRLIRADNRPDHTTT